MTSGYPHRQTIELRTKNMKIIKGVQYESSYNKRSEINKTL